MDCPHCGLGAALDAAYCIGCGRKLAGEAPGNDAHGRAATDAAASEPAMPTLSCPRCGKANALEYKHCDQCGATLRPDLRTVDAIRQMQAAPRGRS